MNDKIHTPDDNTADRCDPTPEEQVAAAKADLARVGQKPTAGRISADTRRDDSYDEDDDHDEMTLPEHILDWTQEQLRENKTAIFIGLGTGAAILALQSTRIRSVLFATGLKLAASRLPDALTFGWGSGDDDDDDDSDDADAATPRSKGSRNKVAPRHPPPQTQAGEAAQPPPPRRRPFRPHQI